MGHCQTDKLLYSKENHKKMKRELTNCEKIFANDAIYMALISKVYQQFM